MFGGPDRHILRGLQTKLGVLSHLGGREAAAQDADADKLANLDCSRSTRSATATQYSSLVTFFIIGHIVDEIPSGCLQYVKST